MQTERRARWESMSEEEKAAAQAQRERLRAERRAKWESMSDEEKAAARAQREQIRSERRAKWESMSDEEKAAAQREYQQAIDAYNKAVGNLDAPPSGRSDAAAACWRRSRPVATISMKRGAIHSGAISAVCSPTSSRRWHSIWPMKKPVLSSFWPAMTIRLNTCTPARR